MSFLEDKYYANLREGTFQVDHGNSLSLLSTRQSSKMLDSVLWQAQFFPTCTISNSFAQYQWVEWLGVFFGCSLWLHFQFLKSLHQNHMYYKARKARFLLSLAVSALPSLTLCQHAAGSVKNTWWQFEPDLAENDWLTG